MGTRIVRFVLIGIFVCYLTSAGQASIVAAKDRADDKRLETHVTISAPSIYLGELLEKLSTQSGVDLSTPDEEPASGIRLSVFLHNVALGDAMNALFSLLSYQKAEWDLDWRGDPDKRRYILHQSVEAKNLASVLHGEIQSNYEQEAAILLASLSMTDKERKQQVKERPELAVDLVDPYVQAGLGVFADAFPGDSYLSALRTMQPIRVPVASLPAKSQATLRSIWHQTESVDGEENPAMPADVVFASRLPQGRVSPSMFLFLGGNGDNYIGAQPSEDKMRARIDARWMLPDDKEGDASEANKIKALDKQTETDKQGDLDRLEIPNEVTVGHRLRQMAKGAPLSLIAKAQPYTRAHTISLLPAPYNQTVKEYLKGLRAVPLQQAHKWRDGILLLSSPITLLNAEMDTPYAMIKKLRRAAQANEGYVPLDMLAEAAATLSDAQLGQLEAEFPILRGVAGDRGILALYYRFADMGSASGQAMNTDIAHALASIGQGYYAPYVQQGKISAVRLYGKRSSSVLNPGQFEVRLVLLSGTQRLVDAPIYYEMQLPH